MLNLKILLSTECKKQKVSVIARKDLYIVCVIFLTIPTKITNVLNLSLLHTYNSLKVGYEICLLRNNNLIGSQCVFYSMLNYYLYFNTKPLQTLFRVSNAADAAASAGSAFSKSSSQIFCLTIMSSSIIFTFLSSSATK